MNDKPIPDFRDNLLAALQNTIVSELLPDLGSSKQRDSATSISRLLARLRADLKVAPTLASQHIDQWRRLASLAGTDAASAGIADPLAAFQIETAHLAEHLRGMHDSAQLLGELAISSSASSAWFSQVVLATRQYLDAYEAAIPNPATGIASPLANPEESRRKLNAYLVARYPQLPTDAIRSFKVIPGGRSKETALFELVPNETLPTRLVLRRDLTSASTGTSVFGEYSLLKAMESLGLPVPKPIAAEKDPAHLGGGFIIVEEVVDSVRAGDLFPELNDMTRVDASFAPDLTTALARLHSLRDYPPGVDLGGHHAATDPVEMVRNFQALWCTLANRPPLAVATELGFAWLLSHPLPTDRPRRLVHGDVGFHNIMIRGGRLAAILDWELTHMGDPAEDIGYIRAPILKPLMPWDQFVARYVAAGGDPAACELQAVNWYSVWAHTRNSVYVAILYDYASRGQRTDIDSFYPAIDFSARCQHYIARELEIALNQSG
jgi:aminoglycoside phosphotransferase (APT) family kinase protein